jgi:uncharacterized protein (TIGR02266 family)
MSDTRKDKRAPVSLKVRFKSATVDEFMEQYARDISRGGLFIKSKSPMPIGTLLKFEVQLRDESPVIRGVGRVVWKREPTEAVGNDTPSGMGIKFIRMDAECRAFVEKIVTQRGDVPGQFEAGGGRADESVPPPASATPATKSSRPRQVTAPFFPAADPSDSDLPLPEDRTQVRHASEFLASALAEAGDSEAAREGERKAEEARRRSEEIERERARQARESERPKAAATTPSVSSIPPAPEPSPSSTPPRARSSEPPAPAATAEPELGLEFEATPEPAAEPKAEPKPEARKPEPEARKPELATSSDKREPSKRIPVAARDLVNDRPPPVEEPNSYLVPAMIGVAAIAAIGYIAMSFGGSNTEHAETPHAASPSERRDEPADEPLEPSAPSEETAPSEFAPSEFATETAQIPSEPVAEASDPAPAEAPAPVPTVRFRIETTPPGAIISVNDTERGPSPIEIEAPIGTALTATARLAGYRIATQEVTPSRPGRPVRMQLAALPYVIEVTTTPPGARVRAGGRTASAAGATNRITISRPNGPVAVSASLAGYLDTTQNVSIGSFTERDGEMVASIDLTLRQRPAPTPAASAAPRPREEAATTRTAAPESERPSSAPPEVERPREASPEPPSEPQAPAAAPEPAEERPSPRRQEAEENEAPPENPF